MNYKEKYFKYKHKYMFLKNNLSGGKYIVGTKHSDKLINSNLTLVQAHGGINITKWYALPENVYLLTTSDIGGYTCAEYNKVFSELINDTNDRTNLKNILKTVSEKNIHPENKVVSSLYEGGNIIYEPGDLIPIIQLEFNNNITSNSANVIYGIFNFDNVKTEDNNKDSDDCNSPDHSSDNSSEEKSPKRSKDTDDDTSNQLPTLPLINDEDSNSD